MNTASVLAALDLLLALSTKVQQISLMIKTAQAEGRDLSSAELESINASDDTAMNALQTAIDKAKAEGR